MRNAPTAASREKLDDDERAILHGAEIARERAQEPVKPVDGPASAKMIRKATEKASESEPPTVRVVIVSDSGDWTRCRKGLAAWSAEKTPGAGSVSGESSAPLAAMWTPALASGDVATLFARLAKEGRTHLDLGEIPAEGVHRITQREDVRARWEAMTVKAAPAADKPKRARKTKPAPDPAPSLNLSGATVRVRISAASWSMLSRERRADLTLPLDGIAVDWREGDGFIYANVPAEAVNALRGMGEAHGVDVKVVESAKGEAA